VKLAAFAAVSLCACAPDPSSPLSKLSSRSPAIAPALTVESFRAFAQSHRDEVGACYDAALAADPAVHGRLTLAFSVLQTGAIGKVEVTASTFGRAAVPACVTRAVAAWQTPFRPDEPVEIEYPLVFSPAP